jgi:hypothetical protein
MKKKKVKKKASSSHRTEDGTYFPYGIFISEEKTKWAGTNSGLFHLPGDTGGEVKAQ